MDIIIISDLVNKFGSIFINKDVVEKKKFISDPLTPDLSHLIKVKEIVDKNINLIGGDLSKFVKVKVDLEPLLSIGKDSLKRKKKKKTNGFFPDFTKHDHFPKKLMPTDMAGGEGPAPTPVATEEPAAIEEPAATEEAAATPAPATPAPDAVTPAPVGVPPATNVPINPADPKAQAAIAETSPVQIKSEMLEKMSEVQGEMSEEDEENPFFILLKNITKILLYPLLLIFLVIYPYIYVTTKSFSKIAKLFNRNVVTM